MIAAPRPLSKSSYPTRVRGITVKYNADMLSSTSWLPELAKCDSRNTAVLKTFVLEIWTIHRPYMGTECKSVGKYKLDNQVEKGVLLDQI